MASMTDVERATAAEDRLLRIARLEALRRGLEARGIYNGAKYLRAAVVRDLLRASDPHLPDSDEALAAELEALAPTLAGDGYGEAFATLLFVAARAAREGSTIGIENAPPAFVCRSCGHLALGEQPAACPDCGAHALTFAEQLPIWFLEPAEVPDTLAALEAGPGAVEMLVADRDDDELTRRPAPGSWSAHDVLEHLLAAERLLAERLPRLLEEHEPDLVARAVWAETPTSDEERSAESGLPSSQLVADYRDLREESLARLRDLPAAGWQRAGWHAEWGRVTVLSQAAYFARHEATHLGQLAAAIGTDRQRPVTSRE
jgi:uncharacterized damage-inducible protein DinB